VRPNKFPPLIEDIKNGEITWKQIEEVDYEIMGRFLCCHLIVEHYLTEALKSWTWPGRELNWDDARLTFNQKSTILAPLGVERIDRHLIPCIKHLNALRNKFGHDITFRLTDGDLEPFVAFLRDSIRDSKDIPTGPEEIIQTFTDIVCACFAGWIASGAYRYKPTRS
jgi:hypothetical protein